MVHYKLKKHDLERKGGEAEKVPKVQEKNDRAEYDQIVFM